MPMGPMGSANPQNIEALAAAGDPRAIAMLQQMQGGGGPPQGGMPPGGPPPQGMPPGGPPPQGMPPQGMPPQGAMPPNPDAQARQTQMLIQLLRGGGQ